MRFRKKPVVIESVQWTGDNASEVLRFMFPDIEPDAAATVDTIKTLEGDMKCSVGDWVIRGVKGELYPCKPDIFEATYQPADEILSSMPTNEQMRALCQNARDCLNTAFEADPAAMHALSAYRVPCTQAMADHPSVVVDQIPVLKASPHFAVGMVGVLVGMFREMGFPCTVASTWDDETDEDGRRKFCGFSVVEFSKVDTPAQAA